MKRPLLEARGMCKAFGDVVALDSVNFSLEEHKIQKKFLILPQLYATLSLLILSTHDCRFLTTL